MNEDRKTTFVKKSGAGTLIRDRSPYLRSHPDQWELLKSGVSIEFPIDEISLMKGGLSDIKTPQAQPKPKRVVKDSKGNIWHDGNLVSGPDFEQIQKPQKEKTDDNSSEDRIKAAQQKYFSMKQPAEEDGRTDSPSNDEADDPEEEVTRPKKRRKKN